MSTTAIIRHRVANFDTWKAGFDEAAPFRAAAGMTGSRIFTDEDDAQSVTAVLDFDSLEQAKKHLTDPMLADKMKALGVLGEPQVHFLYAR